MNKFAITLSLTLVVVALVFSSCTPHRKTLGCPGMITKSKVNTSVVHS